MIITQKEDSDFEFTVDIFHILGDFHMLYFD